MDRDRTRDRTRDVAKQAETRRETKGPQGTIHTFQQFQVEVHRWKEGSLKGHNGQANPHESSESKPAPKRIRSMHLLHLNQKTLNHLIIYHYPYITMASPLDLWGLGQGQARPRGPGGRRGRRARRPRRSTRRAARAAPEASHPATAAARPLSAAPGVDGWTGGWMGGWVVSMAWLKDLVVDYSWLHWRWSSNWKTRQNSDVDEGNWGNTPKVGWQQTTHGLVTGKGPVHIHWWSRLQKGPQRMATMALVARSSPSCRIARYTTKQKIA